MNDATRIVAATFVAGVIVYFAVDNIRLTRKIERKNKLIKKLANTLDIVSEAALDMVRNNEHITLSKKVVTNMDAYTIFLQNDL